VAATGSPLFTPGAAAAWFWALMALWIGSEVWLQRSRGRGGPAGERGADRHSMPALVVGTWAAVGGGLALSRWVAPGRIPDPGSFLVAAGGLVMGLGMTLRWWAIRELGHHFTVRVTTSPDQMLVATGPYRFLRHPAYTGALLTVAGCLLCCADLPALGLVALPIAAYGWRITLEERALQRRFGPLYLEYASRRKRLIPYLF
jgi:protein-S-isoprenylcysteine O-methyltransferase Ste14